MSPVNSYKARRSTLGGETDSCSGEDVDLSLTLETYLLQIIDHNYLRIRYDQFSSYTFQFYSNQLYL